MTNTCHFHALGYPEGCDGIAHEGETRGWFPARCDYQGDQ